MKTKTKILISLIILAVVLTVAFIISAKKSGWFEKPAVYEALVEMRGESAGDVIAILSEGHQWSDTERTSYLILKLKLKPKDAAKLTEPETKETKSPFGSPASKYMATVRARAYRLKIETLRFNPDEIEKGQPYKDKIFGKEMIEKK